MPSLLGCNYWVASNTKYIIKIKQPLGGHNASSFQNKIQPISKIYMGIIKMELKKTHN